MTLTEYLEQGFLSEGDWNCAERTLRAANVAYGLGLSEDALKLAAGFGGGMATGRACGALTGAIMALSTLYVKEYAHESDKIKALTVELFERYEKAMGSVDCEPLKAAHRTPEEKCGKVILAAAKILDDIVAREQRV